MDSGDVVDLVEGHRRGGEGLETLELDHLAEAGHVAAVSEDRRSVSAGGRGVDPKKNWLHRPHRRPKAGG